MFKTKNPDALHQIIKEDRKMAKKLKAYEEPEVTKVEYDFSDRIAASQCRIISATTRAIKPEEEELLFD